MFTSVAQANEAVIERIRNARPHWLDVKPAGALIGALNQNKRCSTPGRRCAGRR